MNCMRKGMEKGITGLFTLLMLGILFIDIFCEHLSYCAKKEFLLPNCVFLLLAIIVVYGIHRLVNRFAGQIHISEKQCNKLIYIFTGVLFVLQVIITYEIIFRTAWDAGIVTAQARLVAQGSTDLWNEYFSECTNNILITFFYSFFYRIAGFVGDDSFGVVLIAIFQCFLNAITGLLLYKISKKIIGGKRYPVFIWIVYVLWVGLSPWFIIPYSDSIGLIFPILLMWIYVSFDGSRKDIFRAVVFGMLSFLGYKIKPTAIIIVIAICVILFMKVIEKKNVKQLFTRAGIVLVSFCIVAVLYQEINLPKIMGMQLDPEREYAFSHYVMVGLHEGTNGVYNSEDVEYSQSFDTNKERSEANWNKIKERLQEYGVEGTARHLLKKTLVNFNDGTFTWGWDGEFYAGVIEMPDHILSPILRAFYYDEGAYHEVFWAIMQFLWMGILLGNVLNGLALFSKKEMSYFELVLLLSVIGLTLFMTIFEARQRYQYVYAPIYVLTAFMGYRQFLRCFGKGKKTSVIDDDK